MQNNKLFTILGLLSSFIFLGAGCAPVANQKPAVQTIGFSAGAPYDTNPVNTPDYKPKMLPSNAELEEDFSQQVMAATYSSAPRSNLQTVPPYVNPRPYGEVAEYYGRSGYKIQFVGCRGNPGNLNIKRGVKFMIDNRDATMHNFQLGETMYIVAPYSYAIAKPFELGSQYITCDGGGAAFLNVQP